MKKWALAAFLIPFIFSLALAIPAIDKTVPQGMDYGEEIEVIVKITTDATFDLAELLPSGWTITSWTVSGNSTPVFVDFKDIEYQGKTVTGYHWIFGSDSPITLKYTTEVKSAGDQTLTSIVIYPDGFVSKDVGLFVNAVCGNGICESGFGENSGNCPLDCRTRMYSDFLVVVLLFLTFMTIVAVAYREYKKYERTSFFFRWIDKEIGKTPPKTKKKPKKSRKSRKR